MLSPQELIAEYRIAFRTCNPHRPDPQIIYDRGWFKFTGLAGRNYRRPAFAEMLETLRQRANTGRDSVVAAYHLPDHVSGAKEP